METENNHGSKPKAGSAKIPVQRFVIRFLFFFVHIYLAFVHALIPSEGKLFFSDEASGRRRRLKQEKLERLFPSQRTK